MSLRNAIMRFSVLGFRSDIRIELQAPVIYVRQPGLEVIKLEFILRLKIKGTDWLLADTCPQAANHCALF